MRITHDHHIFWHIMSTTDLSIHSWLFFTLFNCCRTKLLAGWVGDPGWPRSVDRSLSILHLSCGRGKARSGDSSCSRSSRHLSVAWELFWMKSRSRSGKFRAAESAHTVSGEHVLIPGEKDAFTWKMTKFLSQAFVDFSRNEMQRIHDIA